MSPELLSGHQWRGTLAGLALSIAAIAVAAAALSHGGGSLWSAVGVAVAGAAVISLAVNKLMRQSQKRVRRIREALQAVGRGDMSYRLRIEEMGDFAAEAAALNSLAEAVDEAVQNMGGLTTNLLRLPETIAGAVAEIEQGAENQEEAVEESASLLANINSSIRGINSEVEQLASHNDETASAVIEMGSTIEQVANSSGKLQRSVEDSTAAVHQIAAQIRRVAENSDSVQQVAEETATSIAQMDRAIHEVGEHVSGAAQLTENVSETALAGARTVGDTIEGIRKIREQALDARFALEGLEVRIEEIGQITTVIDGISDETNLLSLNAAIIAAQAGEHGKAFAVVAKQVKTLARRTTDSTKQIENLIQAVQIESKNAVRAMGAGLEAVEGGVERSSAAGQALKAILAASQEASGRVAEIARAAEEQTRNSRHVASAAQQTSDHIQEISAAMNEQSRATDQLLENSTSGVELCRRVTQATEEQRETGQYISKNVISITEMIRSIQERTALHAQSSGGVNAAVATILDNARKSRERIPEVIRAVNDLQNQAVAVSAEVTRFRTTTQLGHRASD